MNYLPLNQLDLLCTKIYKVFDRNRMSPVEQNVLAFFCPNSLMVNHFTVTCVLSTLALMSGIDAEDDLILIETSLLFKCR